ncbi:MAG: sulfurtransferase TusA family protein [Hyphomicrobiales bacterium]|nr:sulfurtransferase TusA family protein [Hyphomicrobiales bacterium]MBV9051497.1 sulfurtransferase TusA family protein [Hyphomicrobiales bacterium]MBV9139152.1 sulfurtransferase TusA family protein [Hyphomicrobiales bacterium]MBV9589644.1 sulfurtransferase TusA family protein [Hyphomicrobiales bacterium]MBV9975244.1 sulfurtransferase TusA family protein [Hyphomicrobiales bacterium]
MALLDLKGLKCPLPALRVRKALKTMAPGEQITAACTDPLARIDIPNLLNETRDRLESIEEDGDVLLFRIRKA